MTRFEACLPLILRHEGGWSDNPKDPGGATMKGVTLEVFSEWLGRPASKAELKAITDAQLSKIYEENYWNASSCGMLPDGVDYMIFDLAVNSGASRAKRYLQSAAGVIEDGQIGPATMKAVQAADPGDLIDHIAERRERFYRNLSTFPTFGKGWLNRLGEVHMKALEMAK